MTMATDSFSSNLHSLVIFLFAEAAKEWIIEERDRDTFKFNFIFRIYD